MRLNRKGEFVNSPGKWSECTKNIYYYYSAAGKAYFSLLGYEHEMK